MKDGTVLVTGGVDSIDGMNELATAELFDPTTGTFTPTKGSMETARELPVALLNDGVNSCLGMALFVASGVKSSGPLQEIQFQNCDHPEMILIRSDVPIEKMQIRLAPPLSDIGVQEIVPVIRGFTDE